MESWDEFFSSSVFLSNDGPFARLWLGWPNGRGGTTPSHCLASRSQIDFTPSHPIPSGMLRVHVPKLGLVPSHPAPNARGGTGRDNLPRREAEVGHMMSMTAQTTSRRRQQQQERFIYKTFATLYPCRPSPFGLL